MRKLGHFCSKFAVSAIGNVDIYGIDIGSTVECTGRASNNWEMLETTSDKGGQSHSCAGSEHHRYPTT